MVTPTLKLRLPTKFTPVAGDVPVVAPVRAQVTTNPGQLSVGVGFGVFTVAEQSPAVLLAVMLDGQVMVGDCVSFTVMVNVQVVVPQPFVAVAVTVVVPTGKKLPEGMS